MNKFTLITTVYNEEKTISNFIDSVLDQILKPNEIVIVDGGSTDDTVDVINDFRLKIKDKRIKFKLITKKGNIAVGRNETIKNAKNEIILVSDVGCILDKNWVKNISFPFKDSKIDVVAGYYQPITNSVFEKCLATYTCVMPDKIDSDNFLPSSRSIAFRKSAWKSVKGYPEWLNTCEDLYFARELKRKGFKFKFVKDAIVYWPQRRNLKEVFKQFYNYAKGDGTARYIRPNTPFLFIRYAVGILLLILALETQSSALFILLLLLFIGYIIWSIKKNYKYVNEPMAILYLPLLQLTADIAVLLGMSIGLVKSLDIKKDKS